MMNMNLELIVRPYVDKVEKWEFKYGGRKVGDTLTFCKKDLARVFLDLLGGSVKGDDKIKLVCQACLDFSEHC